MARGHRVTAAIPEATAGSAGSPLRGRRRGRHPLTALGSSNTSGRSENAGPMGPTAHRWRASASSASASRRLVPPPTSAICVRPLGNAAAKSCATGRGSAPGFWNRHRPGDPSAAGLVRPSSGQPLIAYACTRRPDSPSGSGVALRMPSKRRGASARSVGPRKCSFPIKLRALQPSADSRSGNLVDHGCPGDQSRLEIICRASESPDAHECATADAAGVADHMWTLEEVMGLLEVKEAGETGTT